MNPLTHLPDRLRLAVYVLYAALGPVLIWTGTKGWTGDAEYNLWIGLGVALGLTAASNINAEPPKDWPGPYAAHAHDAPPPGWTPR